LKLLCGFSAGDHSAFVFQLRFSPEYDRRFSADPPFKLLAEFHRRGRMGIKSAARVTAPVFFLKQIGQHPTCRKNYITPNQEIQEYFVYF